MVGGHFNRVGRGDDRACLASLRGTGTILIAKKKKSRWIRRWSVASGQAAVGAEGNGRRGRRSLRGSTEDGARAPGGHPCRSFPRPPALVEGRIRCRKKRSETSRSRRCPFHSRAARRRGQNRSLWLRCVSSARPLMGFRASGPRLIATH